MFEQKVTVTVLSIASAVFWIAGVGVSVAQAFTHRHIGSLGLACVAIGVTLTIRQYLLQDHRRSVAAFELGQEAVRSIR